jgi:hypothetical protein
VCPLLSLRSSSSFLRLLPRLLVTSISPFISPSVTCFRRQFHRKMWPIQLAFRFLISCRILLCTLTLSNTSFFLTYSCSGNSIIMILSFSYISCDKTSQDTVFELFVSTTCVKLRLWQETQLTETWLGFNSHTFSAA